MILKPKESQVKAAIMEWLSLQKNCFAWVNTSTGIYDPTKKVFRRRTGTGMINGVADILGIWRGIPLAIEVKRPGGKLSPKQKDFLERFACQGGIAIVADDWKAVAEYLTEEKNYALNSKPFQGRDRT
jgi:hypothetical protein